MAFPRENNPDGSRIGQSGEPTGRSTFNAGQTERPQPHMVKVDSLVLKDELPIYQASADGLSQAGLGTT